MASITGRKIILPVWDGNETNLTALDTQNGRTLWATKLASLDRPDGRVVDSLYADAEQVYAALPFVVESFRTIDGNLLWTSETLPGHTRYNILPLTQTKIIQVVAGYGAEGALVYNFDTENGTTKSVESYPVWLEPKTNEVSYHVDATANLICIDNKTNQTLWKFNTGGLNGGLELVDSRALIFMGGPHLKSLTAVEPMSGRTLWSTTQKDRASNFIVISNTVYSIASNATIVANDVLAGQEIGRIAFSGDPLDTDRASEYWLVAGDSKLFIYFGDSQEIIALEPIR
jgi:outer membrane protein assembly factor BamB